MPNDDLCKLAQDIVSLEDQGMQLTSNWVRFEPGDAADVAHLQHLSDTSVQRLTHLAQKLELSLQQKTDAKERHRFEHAYNIVMELLQSRAANQSLLEQMSRSDDLHFFEYFRALAIKEQAAAEQARQLEELLL